MLTHVLRQNAKPDASEVIDGESNVTRIVHWEQAFEARAKYLILESFPQAAQAEVFAEVLEEDLDKDSTTRCGFFFVEMDDGQDVPADGIRAEQVAKETGNIAQSVRFVAMYCLVVGSKSRLEQVAPETVDLGEPLPDQAVELGVGAFLRTALNNHGRQFRLHARR